MVSLKFQNLSCEKLSVVINEPVHEISNNVVCVTSKASDQPAHMRSLIRAFAEGLDGGVWYSLKIYSSH